MLGYISTFFPPHLIQLPNGWLSEYWYITGKLALNVLLYTDPEKYVQNIDIIQHVYCIRRPNLSVFPYPPLSPDRKLRSPRCTPGVLLPCVICSFWPCYWIVWLYHFKETVKIGIPSRYTMVPYTYWPALALMAGIHDFKVGGWKIVLNRKPTYQFR